MKPQEKKNLGIEDVIYNIASFFGRCVSIAWRGYQDKKNLALDLSIMTFFVSLIIYFRLIKSHWKFLNNFIDFSSSAQLIWLTSVTKALACTFLSWVVIFVALGLKKYIKIERAQNLLNKLGIKNASGEFPKIVNVYSPSAFREKMLLKPNGVAVSELASRTGNLVSIFGKTVTDIRLTKNKKLIEILLSERDLPELINFDSLLNRLSTPYSFLIGESLETVLSQEIMNLPHLLIAGTSGGGKSNFFRQAILGLLKSSPHLQLYLLDLKKGIEVVEFQDLPNVRIAADEVAAVQILKSIHAEMEKRFLYLKENKKKKIDPIIDQKDLIVVAIDEASILFGKERADSEKKELIQEARKYVDELAKLARASGIHLILATQKPVKEAIDTKVLENLQGRMVFKMMSTAGSNVALGNKHAQDLDSIRGRGIWQNGNEEIEVQTPFITDKEVDSYVEQIKGEFKNGSRKLLSEMIKTTIEEMKNDDENLKSVEKLA